MGAANSSQPASSRRTAVEQPVLHPLKRPDITATNIEGLFRSRKYRDAVAKQLSGAVQIPTVVVDGMGEPGEDLRWEVFYKMTEYLEKTFPRVYKKLKVETTNVHDLLFTWQGSEPTLKPLLFMAHMDVVPVPDSTLSNWTYPPFSGHYDGDFIWGRGSEDDKSTLITMLAVFDALLGVGFEPTRTVILAVGYDEEGGSEEGLGARWLARHLLHRYGEDGIELIIDEGIACIEENFGTLFAMPASAEKGYLDVTVTVNTAGGHSSTPPDHTAIGYLADIIKTIEDNPFTSRLTSRNPTMTYLQTVASYARDMPADLRDAILNPTKTCKALRFMDSSLDTRALVRTSTAVDIVRGGDKANSLPESAEILVNHRIAVEESVHDVKEHYVRIISLLADRWNFHLQGFGAEQRGLSSPQSLGSITLASTYDLEPSPVSDPEDARFEWLTGAIRGVFGKKVIVAPVLLTGNTDTKWYWKLSDQIYRMSPWQGSLDPRGTNMHTVDERMPVEGLLEMIKFYHEFIRIVDEQRHSTDDWIMVKP